MKKLSGGSGGGGGTSGQTAPSGVGSGTLSAQSTLTSGGDSTALSFEENKTTTAGNNTGTAITGIARPQITQVLSRIGLSTSPTNSSDDDDVPITNKKTILKMIMAIESQIMMLRSQLDEDDAMADAMESAQKAISGAASRNEAGGGRHVFRNEQGDMAVVSETALTMVNTISI